MAWKIVRGDKIAWGREKWNAEVCGVFQKYGGDK